MDRNAMLRAATAGRSFDLIVIGGGATGLGIAVDAITRGYSVLLLEARDFGSGTSSRSTKLAHGGVRYLRNGQIGLVREALRERGLLRRNAPELVRDLSFIVPLYAPLDWPMYGAGLFLYDKLAGRYAFGPTEFLNPRETVQRLPDVRRSGLRGGILYHDGQVDDARLMVQLARTAVDHGAVLLNYAPAVDVQQGKRVRWRDEESGDEAMAEAKVVINAAGPFSDEVRRLAEPGAAWTVATSRGSHIVVAGEFLRGGNALMVPRTPDRRVLFAIPWFGHTLIGTTDTPVPSPQFDPEASEEEIGFMLNTARTCMENAPSRADVLSSFAGIRPLVARAGASSTAALSRDHTIRIERSGMLTILGGKWTTYRSMAEDCVNRAARHGGLPECPCRTRELPLRRLDRYEPGLPLHASVPWTEADVEHAVRHEMARTTDDVLSRRTRIRLLNSAVAEAVKSRVAQLVAQFR
ncbi:MAG TPA: glycerol-3-phosphate dehydrogenase/oxidase [Bryobacteraceae bacterium]|nr:glycerol-3-phosphate dehydrogenase/oxidase [Bryobacteraceae bacterium]